MGDYALRWREELKRAVDQHGGPTAIGKAGFDVQLRRWMRPNGPVPSLSSLIQLEEQLGDDFTLADQVRMLSPDRAHRRSALLPEPLRSRQLLLTKLWYAVNEATHGRPVTADLVRTVLDPAKGEQRPNYARWRGRQFEIPTGVAYPHVAFHAVEFQHGPASQASPVPGADRPGLIPAWKPGEFKESGADLDDLVQNAPLWIREVLTPQGRVLDTWRHDGRPVQLHKEDAYDRLELRWRLRELLPLVPVSWYGEVGCLHRGLLYNQDSRRVRHLALVRAYGEQSPDPAARIRPGWLSDAGFTRVLIIGPASALSHPLAALLAEAFGWQFVDVRDLVGELTGDRPAYDAPDRQLRFEQGYRELSGHRYRATANISLIRDTDMLAEHGSLRPGITEVISSPGCFTLVLEPDASTAARWRQRQANMLPQGATVSPVNEPQASVDALRAVVRSLAATQPTHANWALIRWKTSIPWWPDALPEGSVPAFWDARIGDLLVRAGYALATRLSVGRLRSQRTKRPSVVEGSLLGRYAQKLRSDPNVPDLLEETRTVP